MYRFCYTCTMRLRYVPLFASRRLLKRDFPAAPNAGDHGEARRTREQGADHTKAFWYVLTELIVKIISAVGLVTIGFAGFMLQRQNATEALQRDARDRDGRKYLTMGRGLVELEMALNEIGQDEFFGKLSGRRAAEAGAEITALGRSLFVASGQSMVTITVPGIEKSKSGDLVMTEIFTEPTASVSLPVRGAVLMYGELLTATAVLESFPAQYDDIYLSVDKDPGEDKNVTWTPHKDEILMMGGSKAHFSTAIPMSVESASAWRAWLSGNVMRRDFLRIRSVIDASELAGELTRLEHQIVATHPELGDQLTTIRTDVLRLRESERALRTSRISPAGTK